MIHRDIKPDNILVEDKTRRVVIADFGVVNDLQGATRTAPHVFLGTLQYSAAEHVFRDPPSAIDNPAVDVYGIGATLLFAATGHDPYPGVRNAYELADLIRSTPPTIDARPLAMETTRIIRAATSRDPNARPTIEQLRRALSTSVQPATVAPAGYREQLRGLLASDEGLARARESARLQVETAERLRAARDAVAHVVAELCDTIARGIPELRVGKGNGIEIERWSNSSDLRAAVPRFEFSTESDAVIADTYGGHGALTWFQVTGGPSRFECVIVVAEWPMQTLGPGRFLLNTLRVFSGTLDEVVAAVRQALSSLEEAMIATVLRLNATTTADSP